MTIKKNPWILLLGDIYTILSEFTKIVYTPPHDHVHHWDIRGHQGHLTGFSGCSIVSRKLFPTIWEFKLCITQREHLCSPHASGEYFQITRIFMFLTCLSHRGIEESGGLRRMLSQSTESLNFRNRTLSMESLTDDGLSITLLIQYWWSAPGFVCSQSMCETTTWRCFGPVLLRQLLLVFR